jgi:hypothetical protein
LVFSAEKPRSRASAPIFLTPSRSVIAGVKKLGWLIRQVAQCDQ